MAVTAGAPPGKGTCVASVPVRFRKSSIPNCSVEQFGGIYKVTADLMLSGIAGWDRDIYPNIDAPA